MKKFIYMARQAGLLRSKAIILFILLFFMPMVVSVFIIYKNTLEVVKHDKIQHREKLLLKAANNIGMSLTDIRKLTLPISENRGVIKILGDIENISEDNIQKFDVFMDKKFEEARKEMPYIVDYIMISKTGRCFYGDDGLKIDADEFFKSRIYEDVSSEKGGYLWAFDFEDTFKRGESLVFVQKIFSDSGALSGYFVTFVEEKHFEYLHKEIFPSSKGSVVIYDADCKNVFGGKSYYFIEDEIIRLIESEAFYTASFVNKDKKEYSIDIVPISDLKWKVVSIIPSEDLVHSERSSLNGSFWLVMVIVVFSGFFMLFSTAAISNLMTEKEMVNYRLRLTDEMNEKLRIYKHDFMNHLQIVRGLIELGCSERAERYIENISFEGRLINGKYEIGIPEIESTIFANTMDLQEHGIELRVRTSGFTEELDIDIYDLSKILTNLIKNAVYALKNADGDEKTLSIIIKEEMDEYVFEVVNNTPVIGEEIRERIFEKGFTTNEDKGCGLGLYIVKRLVEKNGGRMNLAVDEYGNHFIVAFKKA
ncbi:Sensor_kinase_SpoOB-type, alpha-helical domain [Peptoclostridium litorale DSM 5388]|uniref:histidine kinase n=1 Tax=Peptoclostridium litorale DSM 5388 TaxID=1121324 RepID=A0A069RDS0_PEPLI|nr:ATP-binding protein [Peptoclostridium litorale]KDR94903.1 signal transduction histidine kinase regulating citrate/malate metabolism [Peptoclostridium litorale DSM 5388]SIN95271.1 Sensor_kinase_SpoOB-type, alpha-helical domain [Peptoclostridium litorale DSM 5388]